MFNDDEDADSLGKNGAIMACFLLFLGLNAGYPDILSKFCMAGPRDQSYWVLVHFDVWLMAIHCSHVLDEGDH